MGERHSSGASQKTVTWIRTDKDTHFTSAIVQLAIDTEQVSDVLPNDEVLIHEIVCLCDEAIDYILYIYENSGYNTADADTDATIGEVAFDLATIGEQISSTGLYRLTVRLEQPIHIKNTDKSNDLFLGLSPRSGAKTVGASGEIVFKFAVEPIFGG